MQKAHNDNRKNIACAILAGGRNRRMGRHKAFLDYDGKKFIDVIKRNMSAWFEDIFIVTNDRTLFPDAGLPVFEDFFQGKGPLGGLHTALTVAEKENVFCIACDMPFPHDSLIRKLARAVDNTDFDCFVPLGAGGPEPLFAIYRMVMADLIEKEIMSGQLRVSKVLEKCRTFYIRIEKTEEELININTPQEYIHYAGKIKGMA